MNIHGVGPGSISPYSSAASRSSNPGGFENVFRDALRQVEEQRQSAVAAVEQFLRGENEELHSTALEVQRAELSFELFLQVRNKVVQAYQEIMRMQI
jgi:flagellar hook-basal body complex protein FliE